MTRKERIATTLRFEEPDRPPHFEQIFELSAKAFGLEFPDFDKRGDRKKQFEQAAKIYARIIEDFCWDAVIVCPPVLLPPYDPKHIGYKFIPFLKDYLHTYFGEDVPVGGFLWNSLICIDTVKDYMEFSIKLMEERQEVYEWAESLYKEGLRHAQYLIDAGVDFIDIGSDHAFNSGTLLSPDDFREFVTPWMTKLTRYIQSRGAWVLMHSDGNLMGIMDQILEIKPDALQSIDPMAGMDIREVKRLTYGKVALMGNVQCSYLQEGPADKIIESAEYCLKYSPPGGGYIFSSSNTIFDGVPLENYRVMLDCFHEKYKSTY